MTSKRILVVLTNHDRLGDTGKQTGWYLPEVAHPWDVFLKNGYSVDFVSPKGGTTPIDEASMQKYGSDTVCQQFLNDPVKDTKRPSDVNPLDYSGMYYAGGHGPMWDVTDNKEIMGLAAAMYENGKVIGAVCHGPCGLLNVRLSNGQLLVKGKTVCSFTNEEEAEAGSTGAVPFLLEDALKPGPLQVENPDTCAGARGQDCDGTQVGCQRAGVPL